MHNLTRYTLSIGAAALFAGCGSQAPAGGSGALPQTPTIASARIAAHRLSGSYQELYAFHPRRDGIHPAAGLLNVRGTLYGTTTAGGFSRNGTIYSISTSGVEKVLYRFRGGSDGSDPRSGLIDVKGRLYGTTENGGSSNDGTVYSVSLSGREKVLYAFKGGADGANPQAGLVDVNGVLYGTTFDDGGTGCAGGCGTVFSLSTSGQETVLHSFSGGFTDGGRPDSALVDVNGVLYGTTESGGSQIYGTIFSITPAGVESVLHSFQGGADGDMPLAGLTNVNGKLYGTTFLGGTGGYCDYGYPCGTVYRISTAGVKKVIYNFRGGSDGGWPDSVLINVHGVLYGTTTGGGGGKGCNYDAGTCGAVYSITPRGAESVLYGFTGGTDGWEPLAPVTDVHGTLYGTTRYGGDRYHKNRNNGDGTVFALTP
jgi:uncharacterized repeat protein (TIGR03803 family)